MIAPALAARLWKLLLETLALHRPFNRRLSRRLDQAVIDVDKETARER